MERSVAVAVRNYFTAFDFQFIVRTGSLPAFATRAKSERDFFASATRYWHGYQ